MNGMFPKSGTEFAQFEFFSSRLFSDSVIIFSALFADEKDRFRLFFTFFTFCHAQSPDNVRRVIITELTVPASPGRVDASNFRGDNDALLVISLPILSQNPV